MKRTVNTVAASIVFAGFFGLLAVPGAFGSFGSCDKSSLSNTFGFTLTGTTNSNVANPGPRAAVGQLTADGNGNLTGSETQSNNGAIVTGVTETGTYTVNSDCSGSATLTLKGGGDGTKRSFKFQILHNSEEVVAIVTDAGRIITIDFKQQN